MTTRAGANVPPADLIFCPVGRVVQAAVCKTAEAGAIPARDSNLVEMNGLASRASRSCAVAERPGATPVAAPNFQVADLARENHRLGSGSSFKALQQFGQDDASGSAEDEIGPAGEGRRLWIDLHHYRPAVQRFEWQG